MRVSKVATAVRSEPLRIVSSHSRMPFPFDTRRSPARFAESARDSGFDMPCAWVGPPTTSRVMSSWITSGARPTSTISTGIRGVMPSAIAAATSRVLPNIDS